MVTKRNILAALPLLIPLAAISNGTLALAGDVSAASGRTPAAAPSWDQIRPVTMQGNLKVFWNVGGGDVEYNNREAVAHGFRLVNILNTYSDYPGRQKENIDNALKGNRTNPWKKPDYFERIIRRNIAQATGPGEIMVHDVEFSFEENIDKAWEDAEARAASGAKTKEEFAKAYGVDRNMARYCQL
jgi:hypothetical protein